jgi:hypothetical protein
MTKTYGICHQTFIPVRSEPSESAEMVTELLFGDQVTIFETDGRKKFFFVKIVSDGYEGWIDRKTITLLEREPWSEISKRGTRIFQRPLLLYDESQGFPLWLSAGSIVPADHDTIHLDKYRYTLPKEALVEEGKGKRDIIIASSAYFLNVPYLWGGKSSFGTDCSGLVQNIFHQAGIMLPRDASQQANEGKTLSFISEAKPGDLAFFDNDEGQIVHAGIVLGNNSILHASGRVRIDRLDHQGIFSEEYNGYTHKLRVLKNIIE